MKLTLEDIAKAAHETNRALCQSQGDDSQFAWDDAPAWQRNSRLNGVALHVTDPKMPPAASHEAWLAQKTREGWKYGKVKDIDAKEHPCFMPYDKLPPDQKAKDYIFKATVANYRPYLGANEVARAVAMAAEFKALAVEALLPEEPATDSAAPTAKTPPVAKKRASK